MPVVSKLSIKVYVREEVYADKTNLLEDQVDVSDKNVEVNVGFDDKKLTGKLRLKLRVQMISKKGSSLT